MTTAAVIEATYSKIHEAQEFFEHFCHYWKVPFWQIFSHSGHIDLRKQIKEMLVRWQKTGVCTVLLVLAHTFFQTSMRSWTPCLTCHFLFHPPKLCVCVCPSIPYPIPSSGKTGKNYTCIHIYFCKYAEQCLKEQTALLSLCVLGWEAVSRK